MSYPEHEPYHERSVDAQILDALLRIEELLKRERLGTQAGVSQEPAKEPAPKGRRK